MGSKEVGNGRVHQDATGAEHDQGVANLLDVSDDVRGEQNRRSVIARGLAHQLQELTAGQRVEVGKRLVQEQDVGPRAQRQGERYLGGLPSGQFPSARTRSNAEPGKSGRGKHAVEPWSQLRREAEMLLDR